MEMTKSQCYKIIKAKDSRFDGIFFTAVKTTGIYCRPICKVPAPKEENCIFYKTQAEAESHGYRPCLRCRPELAPEYSEFAQHDFLIKELMTFFEKEKFSTGLVDKASLHLGISTRHINRLFHDNLGVSPKDYIMTKRLLNAKNLLMDSCLSVLKISELVGFGSVSRFNAAIKKHYNLTPTEIRKASRKKENGTLKVKLSYRPPYDWEKMLNFFEVRAVPGVEAVVDGKYRRSLLLQNGDEVLSGWLEIKPVPHENLLELSVSSSFEKVLLDITKLVRKVFDLDASPNHMMLFNSGLRLPGSFDAFEMSTRAILGQQITVKAARTLALRMVETLGRKIETPWEEITHHFPTASELASIEPIEDVLGSLGIIKNRSRVIKELAIAINNGELLLERGQDPEQIRQLLLSMKGVGPWTAEYLMMRGLSYPDAFPVTDIGVKHALMDQLATEEGVALTKLKGTLSKYKFDRLYEKCAYAYVEKYRPWRSYLVIGLWDSLSE